MSELYRKNERVLTLKESNGVPCEIVKIHDAGLLPISLRNDCTVENLNKWLSLRSLPQTREGLEELFRTYGNDSFSSKNQASLTDQYWIKKRTETYSRINFFSNQYSSDFGDAVFTPWKLKKRKLDTFSPDLTTTGLVRKCWRQDQKTKESYMVKAGSTALGQDPLSEVLVSVFLEKTQIIPFIRYDLHIEGMEVCSICKNYITKDTELVPINYIYETKPREKNESVTTHLLKMCELYDIPDAEEFIEQMLFVDRFVGNYDRNLGNIAAVYSVEENRFLSMFPLFDFGNAYYDTAKITKITKSNLFSDREGLCFKKYMNKLNLDVLANDEEIKECIYNYPCMEEERREALYNAIHTRNMKLLSDHSNPARDDDREER